VHDRISDRELDALPGDATLMWDVPLAKTALGAILEWIGAHPSAHIRLHGAAVSQAPALAATRLARLTIAGPLSDWGASYPNVVALTLDADCSVRSLGAAFPTLRSLRIGDGVKRVDARNLARLALTELGLSHVALENVEALASMQSLRSLRIAHVRGLRSIAGIEHLPLATLAIEHQPQVANLDSLRECATLEQMELFGMWHQSIADCDWLFELPALARVEADIGGRRKNTELYKRGRWAYPWPAFSDARVTSDEPLERSG
jgi:hypothetical protein